MGLDAQVYLNLPHMDYKSSLTFTLNSEHCELYVASLTPLLQSFPIFEQPHSLPIWGIEPGFSE